MANVHDVTAYIIKHQNPIDTMKMQKLLYYCQAWNLVWNDKPMFDDPIEAWTNGPVVYSVWKKHRKKFTVSKWPCGNADRLPSGDKDVVDTILEHYGPLTGLQLSMLTHSEGPWTVARIGFGPIEPCTEEITKESMKKFYTDLSKSDTAEVVSEVDWTA